MLLAFRYLPPVAESDTNRYDPLPRPAILQFVAAWETEDQIVLPDPGDFIIYEGKGRDTEDGVPPRFEIAKRLKVEPPKPVEPKVSEVKTLG